MTVRCLPFLVLGLALAGCEDEGRNRSNTPVDDDGDGVTASLDCNDQDDQIAPGLPDLVGDAIDQDCDGLDGVDADGDGVASADSGGMDCDDADPATVGVDDDQDGYPACVDCDDTVPAVNPGAVEVCNGFDEDCSGIADAGLDGVGVCERTVGPASGLDLLFVMDNSCSMAEEQTSVAESAPVLFSALAGSGVDYQVGVVSTDVQDNGRLQTADGLKWVDPLSPTPEATFQAMIMLGTGGSANEQGLDSAHLALMNQTGPAGFNEGFVRTAASLHLILVSDENDHSDIAPADFLADLTLLKAGSQVQAHSIVSEDPVCPIAAEPGLRYEEVTTQTGGLFESICTPPWSGLMVDLIDGLPPQAATDTFVVGFDVDPSTLQAEHFDVDGTSLAVFDAADLTWDPVALSITLPVVVQLEQTVTIRFARL